VGDAATSRAYAQWARRRREFIGARQFLPADLSASVWQSHYLRGTSLDGTKFNEHQTALRLRPFDGWGGADEGVDPNDEKNSSDGRQEG
jgi:hypothetical protein